MLFGRLGTNSTEEVFGVNSGLAKGRVFWVFLQAGELEDAAILSLPWRNHFELKEKTLCSFSLCQTPQTMSLVLDKNYKNSAIGCYLNLNRCKIVFKCQLD